MKKLLIIFAILSIGCEKKEIKIPTLAEKGIQEIHNHSQVWLFFETKNNDTIANINKKNTISSTHWIYNIDKRLPLKSIIPSLISLKYKHANSMHSEKGMHDYFSYSDTISKKLSFIEFDSVSFVTDSLQSKYEIKKEAALFENYFNLNLTFSESKNYLNDTKVEKEEFKSTLIEFIEFSAEGKQTMLHLNFNEKTSYQTYLYFKTMLSSIKSDAILLNTNEYIFNENKVPDCGCN